MLDELLEKVKHAIWKDDSNMYHPDSNRGGLINQIEDLFTNHKTQYGNHAAQSDERFKNVRPASEDRYGDPADQEDRKFGKVLPASRDPYGDPADLERRR